MHDTFFITSVEHFSYWAIFFFALFSGYLIPIPEEIILLITGYMAWAGLVHLVPAVFVAILAFIIGDNILYRLTLRNNKHVEKLIQEVFSLGFITDRREFLEKNIGTTIFLTRFIPFLRFVGPVFSGYIKVREKTFMLFNTLAIIIYAPLVIWIGYFFNGYFEQIIFRIGKVKHFLFIALLIILGLLITRAVEYFLRRIDKKQ